MHMRRFEIQTKWLRHQREEKEAEDREKAAIWEQ